MPRQKNQQPSPKANQVGDSDNYKKTLRPERFFKTKPAGLYLKSGEVFPGRSPVWQEGSFSGEVVFNTGMTGYVESLTDPSYTGQILVFTYPLIGNYGVQLADAESPSIQVAGVVTSEAAEHFNHVLADYSLYEWLAGQGIPLLTNVDTRSLTKHLRTSGTMPGVISQRRIKPAAIKLPAKNENYDPPEVFNGKRAKTVILVDCGAKGNILNSLKSLPLSIKKVPADYDYSGEDFDGVVISNGPGDPKQYKKTIAIAGQALRRGRPVFGICLGSQIMALAAGAKTYKLRFGHRGHNQPCMNITDGKCFITSQNHGYAIASDSLPSDWEVTFKNLNDGSVEGIRHKSKPFFSVQFHPEAHPGPTDTAWLFNDFYAML